MKIYPTDIEERDSIDGRPYFGVWFRSGVGVHIDLRQDEGLKREIESTLLHSMPKGDFEYRYQQFTHSRPESRDPVCIIGVISLECLLWGRAYKVMRLFKKGVPRYKKSFINGVMKRRRVDK